MDAAGPVEVAASQPQRRESVREELLAIDDPLALSSLREMLLKKSLFPVKRLWLQAIEEMAKRDGMAGERAIHTLAMLSLESLDEPTHAEIVSFLQERQSPELIGHYVQILIAVDKRQPQEISAIAVDRVQIVLRKFRLENVIPPLVKQLKIIKHVAVVSKGWMAGCRRQLYPLAAKRYGGTSRSMKLPKW
ncbi:MAG: hypothetical protein U0894_13065 [Pirellulales bacterium]